MKNKTTIKTILGIAVTTIILVIGCNVGNEITSVNLAGIYHHENLPVINGVRIFNETDSMSRAYVRYNSGSLLYTRNSPVEKYKSDYMISYKLFPSYESNTLIDSASFVFADSLHYNKPVDLVHNFEVKAPYPGEYLLEITLTDRNKQTSMVYPQKLNKQTKNSSQYFLPLNEADQVIFEDWVNWKTKFRIITSVKDIERLFAAFYDRQFPIARPPFSMAHEKTYEYKADERFTVGVINGESEVMQFAREGFFHFQSDTTSREGLTLYRFHDNYPAISDPAQMVPPLRYITTTKEFNRIMRAGDPKMAVDSFWIKIAGNEDRAVEMIQEYYGRVETANARFNSYKEGWKTDRGMMYIVFGPPRIVYRRTNIETWIYGEPGNRVSLRFDFIESINPFTGKDYTLQRQEEYKSPWFIAVDYWRR